MGIVKASEKRNWVPIKDPEDTQKNRFHYGVIPSETGSRESGHKTHGVSTFSDCNIFGVNCFTDTTELWLKLDGVICSQP